MFPESAPVPTRSPWILSTPSSEPAISSEPIIERLSSKQFPAQAKAHTVPELKANMDKELNDSTVQDAGLAAAVFPDTYLPITIDAELVEKLVPPGTTARATRQTKPKSILLNPPKFWTENNFADWLNSIGDALETMYPQLGTYLDVDGKQAAIAKRRWSPRHHGSILDGSPIRRKPDVILVDRNCESEVDGQEITWQKVHAVCEVTVSERKNSKTIKETVRQKSYLMLTTQVDRCFTICLDFTCDSFTLTVIDRAGLVHSETLKVLEEPATLLRIIVGLMFGRPSDIGHDETMECGDDGKAKSLMVGGKRYQVEEELFRSESVRGRATKCWRVSRSEGGIVDQFVVKDSWVDVRRTQSEIMTLTRICNDHLCEGQGVPRLICGEDVRVPTGPHLAPIFTIDSTARRRATLANEQAEERVHRRLLMGPVGIRITEFRSLKELVGAFIDVVQVHDSLCNAKILHRDISLNNIMLSPAKNEGERHKGLLIDYDYAFVVEPRADSSVDGKNVENIQAAVQNNEARDKDREGQEDAENTADQTRINNREVLLHRTGTLPFMAVELLMSDGVEHSEKHDLESFFYVLLYICTMCEGPGQPRNDENRDDANHPFGNWIHDAKTWHVIGAYRSAAFSDSDVMQKKVLAHIHPYFNPLTPMLTNFCDVIFGTYALEGESVLIRNPQKARGTHEKVLSVLKSAFDTLPDEDVSGIPRGPGDPQATPASTLSRNLSTRQTATVTKPGDINMYGSDSGYGGEDPLTATSRSSGGSLSPHKRSSLRLTMQSLGSDSGYGMEDASTSASPSGSLSPHKRSSLRLTMQSLGSDSGYGREGTSTSASPSGSRSHSPKKRSSQRGAMNSVGSESGHGGEDASTSTSRSGGGRSPNKRNSQQSVAALPSSKRRRDNQ